jgi:hypothetical protein
MNRPARILIADGHAGAGQALATALMQASSAPLHSGDPEAIAPLPVLEILGPVRTLDDAKALLPLADAVVVDVFLLNDQPEVVLAELAVPNMPLIVSTVSDEPLPETWKDRVVRVEKADVVRVVGALSVLLASRPP